MRAYVRCPHDLAADFALFQLLFDLLLQTWGRGFGEDLLSKCVLGSHLFPYCFRFLGHRLVLLSVAN